MFNVVYYVIAFACLHVSLKLLLLSSEAAGWSPERRRNFGGLGEARPPVTAVFEPLHRRLAKISILGSSYLGMLGAPWGKPDSRNFKCKYILFCCYRDKKCQKFPQQKPTPHKKPIQISILLMWEDVGFENGWDLTSHAQQPPSPMTTHKQHNNQIPWWCPCVLLSWSLGHGMQGRWRVVVFRWIGTVGGLNHERKGPGIAQKRPRSAACGF